MRSPEAVDRLLVAAITVVLADGARQEASAENGVRKQTEIWVTERALAGPLVIPREAPILTQAACAVGIPVGRGGNVPVSARPFDQGGDDCLGTGKVRGEATWRPRSGGVLPGIGSERPWSWRERPASGIRDCAQRSCQSGSHRWVGNKPNRLREIIDRA